MFRTLIIAMTLLLAWAAGAQEPDDTAYRIGGGDTVSIQVFGEAQLSGDQKVREDGSVFLPFVEEIEIAGLTAREAGQRIRERLAAGYLVSPQVLVQVTDFKSQKVNVVGAVKRPGEYYLTGPTTLLDLLARAGNVDSGKSAGEIRIKRADGTAFVVRLDALLAQHTGNVMMRADDLVSVPEGQYVYVAGEVAKPGAVPFWEGLTVTQALTTAGGPAKTARLKGAYILREGEQVPVNLKRILEGRDADISLQAGDQLFLKESPL